MAVEEMVFVLSLVGGLMGYTIGLFYFIDKIMIGPLRQDIDRLYKTIDDLWSKVNKRK